MPSALLQAVAALPLIHGTRVLGGFAVSFDSERAFDDDEQRWLTGMAAQAAVAADRARLVDDLTKTVRLNELFMGVLAHDLRAPLAAIMTAAQLMKVARGDRDGDADATRRRCGRIVTSGERMARMIEQLLDFTRLRVGGGMTLEPETDASWRRWCKQVVGEVDDGYPNVHGDGRRRRRHGRDLGRRTAEPDAARTWSRTRAARQSRGRRPRAHRGRCARRRARAGAQHGRDSRPTCSPGLRSADRRPAAARRSRGLGLGLFISKRIVAAHGGERRGVVERGGGHDVHGFVAAFRRGRRGGRPPRRPRRPKVAADNAATPRRSTWPPRAGAAARERGTLPPAGGRREGLRDLHARSERPGRRPGTPARSGSRATRRAEIIGQSLLAFYEQHEVRRRQVRARAGGRGARRTLRGRGLAAAQGRHAVLGERGDHRAAQPRRRAGRVRQGDARSDRAPPAGTGAAAAREAPRRRSGCATSSCRWRRTS